MLEARAIHWTGSLIDTLDRILDKGMVIDAWVRISQVGIVLANEPVRIVIERMEINDGTDYGPSTAGGEPPTGSAPPHPGGADDSGAPAAPVPVHPRYPPFADEAEEDPPWDMLDFWKSSA